MTGTRDLLQNNRVFSRKAAGAGQGIPKGIFFEKKGNISRFPLIGLRRSVFSPLAPHHSQPIQMKKSNKSIIALASIGATAFLATAGHAALVLQYDYTGTPGTQAPNPTLDTSPSGSVANGTLPSGVTYAAGDSRGGAGTHANFSGLASGTGVNFTSTGADTLRNTSAATLFTDFRLTSNITTGDPRLIFLSTSDSSTAARAEIRLNTGLGNTGVYSFRTGARSGNAASSFRSVTSDTFALTLNQWYTLATVIDYSNDTIKIFLNGVDIVSGSEAADFVETSTPDTNSNLALIGNNGGVAPAYSGDFDNTRIYNDDQSANIAALSIPEPSTALLGALGVLALLRRRR